jgi:hypothetical protein
MRKNMINRSSNFNMKLCRPINRKRSQKWLSDETKLLNKYGLSSRYMDKYVL